MAVRTAEESRWTVLPRIPAPAARPSRPERPSDGAALVSGACRIRLAWRTIRLWGFDLRGTMRTTMIDRLSCIGVPRFFACADLTREKISVALGAVS